MRAIILALALLTTSAAPAQMIEVAPGAFVPVC